MRDYLYNAAGDYMERACKTYEKCEVNVIAGGAHGFPSFVTHVKANENVVRFLKRIL